MDTKHGKPGLLTLRKWVKQLDLRAGSVPYTQRTPSGGLHYLFRIPAVVDATTLPNRTDAAPGIDVLRDGRQFVVYPSVTDKGPYRLNRVAGVLPPIDELREIPPGLLQLLQDLGGDRARATSPVDQEALTAPGAETLRAAIACIPNDDDSFPSRDDYIRMGYAIKAASQDFEAEGLAVFQDWASRSTSPRVEGNPETPLADWRRMHGPYEIGWDWITQVARQHGFNSAALDFELVRDDTKPRAYKWLRELNNRPEPPRATLPRIAWPGRVTVLGSAPKDGKSTLITDGVARLSQGHDFLGEPTTPGAILWLALDESVDDLHRRLVQFGANPDRVAIVTHRAMPDEIRGMAQETGAVLVVIDTLARYARGRVEQAGHSTEWTKLLEPLTAVARELGPAIVIAHHVKKGTSDLRDSTAIAAESDVILTFKPHRRGQTERTVEVQHRIVGLSLDDFTLAFSAGRYTLADAASDAERATHGVREERMWAIFDALRRAEPEALSSRGWQQAVGEALSLRRTAFYDARKALVLAGWVAYNRVTRRYSATPNGEEARAGWVRDSMRLLESEEAA